MLSFVQKNRGLDRDRCYSSITYIYIRIYIYIFDYIYIYIYDDDCIYIYILYIYGPPVTVGYPNKINSMKTGRCYRHRAKRPEVREEVEETTEAEQSLGHSSGRAAWAGPKS